MESESPGTLLVLEPKSLRSFTTNDEYLYAMKEDLADWFACLYKLQIDAETFLAILETGVILCRHANEVQHFFKERRLQGAALAMRSYFIRSVPEGTVTFRQDVKPGTFQARDNVSNFITWCRHLGIPDVLRFETDDLVLRKNEKSVILCLLELARVGAKLGMLAPTLVQMEQEIDQEIESGEPPPQIKTCDMKSLDELVRELVGQCTCPVQFPMNKVGEGKYQIGDSRTLIFVRVLRNHVMVRVGGGWDTLENYLDKHDPCRCHFKGHRSGNVQGPRHQILRRASTSNLIATRANASPAPNTTTTNNNNSNNNQTSPRRMSSAAAPPPNSAKGPSPGPGGFVKASSPGGFVKGSSPGPSGAGGFVKGASPARCASPTPAGFLKGPSPQRSASPVTTTMTTGPNGVRRLPSTASAHSLRESAGSLRESAGSLRESQSFRDARELRESRESSVGRSGSGSTGLSRPSSPSLRQSHEQPPRSQQQQQQGQYPQHQAVQRCKSPPLPLPPPPPPPRSVAVCVTRPLRESNPPSPRFPRGLGHPRPMSPAVLNNNNNSNSNHNNNNNASGPNARRQLFTMNRVPTWRY